MTTTVSEIEAAVSAKFRSVVEEHPDRYTDPGSVEQDAKEDAAALLEELLPGAIAHFDSETLTVKIDEDATELHGLLGDHDVLSHFSDRFDRDVWVVERRASRSVVRRELDGELRVFASEAEYDENVALEAPDVNADAQGSTTITSSQIRKLEAEAVKAGDSMQAYLCRIALGNTYTEDELLSESPFGTAEVRALLQTTQDEARAECARVIGSAAAMEDAQ